MTWRPSGGPERSDPQPVSASLERIAGSMGAPDPATLAEIFGHWEEIVGPEVARHAAPANLRRGVLTITVARPAWATQLRYLSSNLMDRLAEHAGAEVVTEIVVRVRPGPGEGGSAKEAP